MSNLHYTELFYSIQGEGRYQGVPSVFLRTFGCNFRCRNFGRNRNDSSDNQEVISVINNIENYKEFKDLPLVSTGCDSYSSVYPDFKSFAKRDSTDSLAQSITDILPFKTWREEHLVITGGEPLLGWQRAYPELLNHEKMLDLKELTFETNGTQELNKEFRHCLLNWTLNPRNTPGGRRGRDSLTFSVSPKLSNSGEKWEDAIRPEVVMQYEDVGYTYLKFVVAMHDDVDEALEATNEYRKAGFKGPVYLMPVGGVENVYSLNNQRVADLAMKYGLRYSDRLQVPLFKNRWGT